MGDKGQKGKDKEHKQMIKKQAQETKKKFDKQPKRKV